MIFFNEVPILKVLYIYLMTNIDYKLKLKRQLLNKLNSKINLTI